MADYPELDPVIHTPKRMQIMAMLSVATSANFQFLQDELNVSASVLSKQMSVLTDAGYVKVKKTGHGRSGSTVYSLTKTGATAYQVYKKAIKTLLNLGN